MESADSATSASGAGVDAPATVLGLAGASRAEADAFLRDQRRLIALQALELSHEIGPRHWSLWVRNASGILKLILELFVGLVLLALVAGINLMVWNAAHSDGLLVESFSVPPDMAARGLTGQVIAGQLTDKLTQLQAGTDSNRAPRSYINAWGDDIKVEIPDTGISIAEVYRFLRRWLGHEIHVGGDVWRTASGVVIAARINGGGGTIAGTEAELDDLIQKTAEEIFKRTQPYRYAVYLQRHDRVKEANVIRRELAETGHASERAWANFAMGVAAMNGGYPAEQERLFKLAAPHPVALGNLAILEDQLGRPELARRYMEQAEAHMRDGGGDINPDTIVAIAAGNVARKLTYQFDYRAALREMEKLSSGKYRSVSNPAYQLALVQLLDHDPAAARRTMQRAPMERWAGQRVPAVNIWVGFTVQMGLAGAAEDWAGVLSLARTMDAALRPYPGQAVLVRTADDPQTAIAEARLGKFAAAEHRLSKTPADCYPCLMARAVVADLQGQAARSDFWFTRAVASNPSVPAAEAEWGQALLKRGQPNAAIEKFRLAGKKGPHFADPLEGWGEALMAKNQSHLALEKFAEAEKNAPNWGRLHLKWGEALLYASKPAEAKAQLARAATLHLTPSEKSELARLHV